MKPTWEDAREWLGAEPYALVELHPDAVGLDLDALTIEPNRLVLYVDGEPRYVVGWEHGTRIVVWKKLRTETE